jgi:hypothetical protein
MENYIRVIRRYDWETKTGAMLDAPCPPVSGSRTEAETVAEIDEHIAALVVLSEGIRWGDDRPGTYALQRLTDALNDSYPERVASRSVRGRSSRRSYTSAAVLRVAGVTCRQCGSTDRVVLDHIVPLAQGGADDEGNLQPLCTPCNTAKGGR